MQSRNHPCDQQDAHERCTAAESLSSEPARAVVADAVDADPDSGEANASVESQAFGRRGPPPLPGRSVPSPNGGAPEVYKIDPSTDSNVSIEQVCADDDALVPVERSASRVAPTRRRTVWLGWAAATALLIGSGTHYVMVYRPLEEQSELADRTRLQRLHAHEAQLSSLRSELERTRAELEEVNVEVAAQKASVLEAAAPPADSTIQQDEPAQAPTKQKPLRRSVRRGRQSSGSVSNPKGSGASSRRKSERQASKESDSAQPLRGVLSSSNDPLEGL